MMYVCLSHYLIETVSCIQLNQGGGNSRLSHGSIWCETSGAYRLEEKAMGTETSPTQPVAPRHTSC